MQLNLAFLDPDDQPPNPSATPWDQMDEQTRDAALDILARVIARMLAAEPVQEASDE
jgi:hypothetical protein